MNKYINLEKKIKFGKSSNIRNVHDNDVDNIETVKIDFNKSKVERMLDFLLKVKNPYIFSIDGIKVKFEFSENGNDINKCFENLLISKSKCNETN